MHSLDFPVDFYMTKIGQYNISYFLSATGPISQFVILALYRVKNRVFYSDLRNCRNQTDLVNTLAHTQSHSHISNDKITHTRTVTLNNKVRYVIEKKNYRQKKNRLKNYRLICFISEFAKQMVILSC